MITDAQKWLWFSGLVFTGWLLYLLAPVLAPFVAGALLAYLGDPITDKLEARKLSRTVAVSIVFAVMLLFGALLLLIIMPLLQEQISSLFRRLPQIINWLQSDLLPAMANTLGLEIEAVDLGIIQNKLTENWRDVGSILGLILGKVSHSGQVFITWLAYLVLVPVVTFYLLRDWDILVEKTYGLIPRRYAKTVSRLTKECDSVLSEFLRGQLIVMFALGCIYSIGLFMVGLEFALLIGMMAGLVSFVPYLGAIVGIGVAGIVGFMQFHDIFHLVLIGIVFGVGQAIEGMLLSPLLVGDRIGLHPVAVIFAVMAGGQLFGFFGVLLALPVAAVIKVLLGFVHQHYIESDFYTP